MSYTPTINGTTVDFAPGYGPESGESQQLIVDPVGQLQTRATVLTDEGTFRANFANSSLWVSIGTVTVAGNIVTGTGFAAADIHLGDYFKVTADADSDARQVDSVDSDTQITLVGTYTGSASGAASRALVLPSVGTGQTITVASGQATIAAGTTATSVARLRRALDYAPFVVRQRLSISQRIANQSIYIGGGEDVAAPRWFCRFTADGTTATTIKCQTARNPSGAPSASETEETVVTLPNGATTAQMLDYRIEVLVELVRFFIEGILVASHSRVIPSQHDQYTVGVSVENGTTPASGTSVVVDYITGKNHNKLEVGIFSEADLIVAAQPPLEQRFYSVTGAITINTDLIVMECSRYRSLFIQCTSMGTSGVVTGAWSHDGTTWVTATLWSEAGASSTTFNAAVLRVTNVFAKYFRLRLTTGASAGTTTIYVQGSQLTVPVWLATQPVSGTITANIGTGSVAAGTNLIGDVGNQIRANATGAPSRTHLVSAGSTNATNIKASAGRVAGWHISNTNAAYRYVKLHNSATTPTAGAGVVMTIAVPPNGTNNMPLSPLGMGFSTGIGYTMVTGSADADATGVGSGDLIMDLYWA
jgi:hypothetical protein